MLVLLLDPYALALFNTMDKELTQKYGTALQSIYFSIVSIKHQSTVLQIVVSIKFVSLVWQDRILSLQIYIIFAVPLCHFNNIQNIIV